MPNFRFLRPTNTFILSFTIILLIFGFYWLDGFYKEKKVNPNISFPSFVKADLIKKAASIKSIPDIFKEATLDADNIKIGSLNKIAEALELYQMDNGHYPKKINEIIGTYINSKTSIFQDPSFYYRAQANNYELRIKLSNGKIYKIKK